MTIHRLTATRLLAGLAIGALLAGSACSAPTPGPQALPSAGGPPSASAPASASASRPATASASETVTVTDASSTSPAPTSEPSTSAKPGKAGPKAASTEPAAMMAKGASGGRVRELQHRLRQLKWFTGTITGHYGKATAAAVDGFQDRRKLKRSGKVDRKTWAKLVSMTKKPSRDDLYNIQRPGKAIMKKGSQGDRVRNLQARLKQISWFSGKVTGSYGSKTVRSIRGFQAKRSLPVTGETDARTWRRLTAMTHTPSRSERHNVTARITAKPAPARLDERCMRGRVLCVSKRTDQLVWVVDGRPQLRVDVRFGSQELPTRNGSFRVRWKSRHHVSSIYHTPMPYAMFFSGGQAVHYSRDFAARGYAGRSHGCVNVRDRGAIRRLFSTVRVGDKVIVYA